jgi:quinoprotein glucose dehydrogenase
MLLMKKNTRAIIISVFSWLSFLSCSSDHLGSYTSWHHYKGSEENIQYSSLTEIDTNNVRDLQVAWEYHTGDADTANHSQIQCNPIMVNGMLYGTTPQMKLFAVDARTGKQVWVFNPFDSLAGNRRSFFIMNNSRGLAYWTDGAKDRRVYYTAGPNLYCLDADSGKLKTDFGKQGKIDLHGGLDREVDDYFVTATSPGIIYNDLIIMGSRVDEGPVSAPGHIRAFDVRTGERKWIFHTIPKPGEYGYSSWDDPKAYEFIGGANSWSGFSLDKKRGIVFACTGSASYDFYGGKRTGDNLFANSVLALDAKTGKRIWHFQGLHHDVWDRDFSSAPLLVTIKKEGKEIDAVVVSSKTGFIYVFERATGKPVFDIVERPVPTDTDLEGEKLSPTQPYPVKPAPFARQTFTEKDINPLLPDSSYQQIKKRLAAMRSDHMYNPPSFRGTVILPGLDGGGEWGGPSFDPETGVLYVNANEMAWTLTALDIRNRAVPGETNEQAGIRLYKANCMTCHGPDRKGSGNIPSLINIYGKYSALSFDTLVQSGRRMMPAFKHLNETERKAIASFVLDLKKEKTKPFQNTNGKRDPRTILPYSMTGYYRFQTSDGLPAISPPWGTLNAIDLNTGEFVWKKTLGTDPAFPQSKEPTGSENYGASVVTRGGLLIIAATKDGKLRAFNKRNGELLWEKELPVPAFATPAVYELDGRQYIVIACGGGKLNTKAGDSYIAFALSDKK